MRPEGLLLAIDTATSMAVVAVGDRAGRLLAEERWAPGFRHGEELLIRVDALLASVSGRAPRPAGASSGRTRLAGGVASAPGPSAEIAAIVVGTGPGAFTGLRVGLATVKGLALALGRPVVGVPTGLALLEAAREPADGSPVAPEPFEALLPAALLLPAGPSDRILVRTAGESGPGVAVTAVRLGPDDAPDVPLATIVAVDLDGRADPDALARGRRAQASLSRALLRLGAERLATHGPDDLATLVPEYVTLPRGVERETGRVVVGPA